jgi:hypothetical protein
MSSWPFPHERTFAIAHRGTGALLKAEGELKSLPPCRARYHVEEYEVLAETFTASLGRGDSGGRSRWVYLSWSGNLMNVGLRGCLHVDDGATLTILPPGESRYDDNQVRTWVNHLAREITHSSHAALPCGHMTPPRGPLRAGGSVWRTSLRCRHR